ncbi:hypothetical protein [Lactococcus termiticola]|uniref:SHOCT domain-containing protein n=1 Tax=Lactococcus termiticola TaxID=2169526 RepID=A0A2R5HIS4_9LACT|nr:hypothetical protein [Lactococcus termiticola]GBG95981.1 hypothetical protein NtB2_00083 [Lactococcus termiticola]
MSTSKIMVLIGNIIGTIYSLFLVLTVLSSMLLETEPTMQDVSGSPAWKMFLPLIVLIFLVNLVAWLAFIPFDGKNRRKWRIFFLVLGIINVFLNFISAVFYILAFALIDKTYQAVNHCLTEEAKVARLSDLSELLKDGVINKAEFESESERLIHE